MSIYVRSRRCDLQLVFAWVIGALLFLLILPSTLSQGCLNLTALSVLRGHAPVCGTASFASGRSSYQQARLHMWQGRWQQLAGDEHGALAEYRAAQALAPDSPLVAARLADVLWDNERFQEAVRLWIRYEAGPLIHHKAQQLAASKHWEDVAAVYREVYEADPAATYPLPGGRRLLPAIQLGYVYLKLNRGHEAERIFREAMVLWPENTDGYAYLAYILLARGDDEEGMSELRNIILEHFGPAGYRQLGWAYDAVGQLEQSTASYSAWVAAEPRSAAAHYWLGMAYQRQGELDLAHLEWRKALQLDPHYKPARQALGNR